MEIKDKIRTKRLQKRMTMEELAEKVGVSKRLGHSDTKMTLNTYAHLMPQEEDKVIAAFNGI